MVDGVFRDREHFDGGVMGLESGVKNEMIKLPRCVLSWLHEFRVINVHQAPYACAYEGLGVAKQWLLCAEIPYKTEKLYEKCKDIYTKGPTVRRSRDAIGAVTDLWDSVQETIEVAYAGLPEEAALLLKRIGSPALGIGMVCLLWKDGETIFGEGAKPGMNQKLDRLRGERQELIRERDELIAIHEAQRNPEQTARIATVEKFIEALEAQRINTWIHIAQWVSYLVLAGLLVATAFFAAAIAGWVTLACSTAALACSIIGHYYQEFAIEPLFRAPSADGKGMNLEQLREYCIDDEWNVTERVDGNGQVVRNAQGAPAWVSAGRVGKLPHDAEARLKAIYREDAVRPQGWHRPDRLPQVAQQAG